MKKNNTKKNDETIIQMDLNFESIPDAAFCVASLGSLLSYSFKERITDTNEISGNKASALSLNLYHIGNLIEQISHGIVRAASEIEDSTSKFLSGNTINVPIEATVKKVDSLLQQIEFNAPLPPLKEIDRINLQISLKQEVK